MFAITMHGLFWNAALGTFSPDATRYATEAEACEVAQEDAALPAGWPWFVVRL